MKNNNDLLNEYNIKQLSKPNFILYNLKGKTTNKLWEDEEDKKCVLEYIYKYCQDNEYMKNKIEQLAKSLEMSPTTIRRYAQKYALEYLGYTEEQYNEQKAVFIQANMKRIYYGRQTKVKQAYEKLLKVNTIEEIVLVIENSQVDLIQLKERVADFVIVYKNGNEKIEEELKQKIKMYINYIMEQKRREMEELSRKENEAKLPIAIKVVSLYLNDKNNTSVNEYCKNNNISIDTFNEYIELLKNEDSKLYYSYLKKIEYVQNQEENNNLEKIKLIIFYIKNGIEEYGQVREFDIIDYFMIIDVGLDKALKLAKDNFSKEDFIILAKFVDKNITGNKNNSSCIRQIMKEKVILNYQKDASGLPIPGTEEVLERTEKEKLINYLKEYNIPLNLKTYNCILKRYKSGILTFEENSVKK